MTADYSQFQTGAVVEPLTSSLTNSLLLDADPAIYYALDFFAWILGNSSGPISPRLLAAASAAGAPITSAVMQKYPSPLDPYKLTNQFLFPLLAVYRRSTDYDKFTSSYYNDKGFFDLMWVMPPLTQGQAQQILPIFRAAEVAIRDRCVQGYDPSYAPPGGSNGDQPWSKIYAYVNNIGLLSSQYGILENMSGEFFPTLKIQCFVEERQNYIPLSRTFAGADLTEKLIAPDGTTYGTIDQVSTQAAPTITSLSASSGTYAGGTSVTIGGTLFGSTDYVQPLQVLFGNNHATSVTLVSSTEITCVTPAMSGPGVVNITIINQDGQTVVEPAAFTFD